MDEDNRIDLFVEYETLPAEVQALIDKYVTCDSSWANCEALEAELKPLGYTFEWGMSGEPYDLRKINE